MFSRLTRVSSVASYKCLQSTMRNVALMKPQYRTLYTINVGDLMNRMGDPQVLCISATDRIRIAAQTMESEKIGALVVVNENNEEEMVGILTARDIQQAVAEYEESDLPTVVVKDVMTPASKVQSASVNDNLEDVATMMIDNNIRHIPVMDKKGINCGMLSIKDVVREVLNEEKEEIRQYERIVNDSYSAGSN